MRADARYWFEIDNELAFRIAIARMEGLAITRAALHQSVSYTHLTLPTKA